MEPLFFKAENKARFCPPPAFGGASMEPLFFKAENCTASTTLAAVSSGFNGAAFFQSGKFPEPVDDEKPAGFASMEPLFFKAEN